MRQFYFVGGLILGLAVAIFALQNTVGVEVRFLSWQVQGPLAAVVLASSGAGLLVALLCTLPAMFASRRRIRSLERRLETERPSPPGPPGEPR
ncbi:MAG TPA: lipopolysaccharide assembly protein LapA domain-containing protein [Candidatus Sulfotelmatobacter sp.]|jgi:uncharacterized integral membrane protein|nr:lipopolysaccharide assembly protein LapA domain-containing protein [Candidatus Sulfotelmatobacter sp.]